RVLLANIAGGITIPYAALLDDGGQPFVFVIANTIAKRRDIVVGPRTGDRISVTSGLKPGERVATVGVTALEDGMKTRIQGAKK
ncbi:MAG: efflux RND transporter periplasmic adaptor subunit, partial [Sphingopyxis sp.]